MDEAHIARWLSLHMKGVLTAQEVANGLLVELIRDDHSDTDPNRFVGGLPTAVRQALQALLWEVQADEYRWRPFTFGPGGSVLDTEEDDTAKLRSLCAVLEIR